MIDEGNLMETWKMMTISVDTGKGNIIKRLITEWSLISISFARGLMMGLTLYQRGRWTNWWSLKKGLATSCFVCVLVDFNVVSMLVCATSWSRIEAANFKILCIVIYSLPTFSFFVNNSFSYFQRIYIPNDALFYLLDVI